MFSLFNFSPIFRGGGQLTPFALCVDAHGKGHMRPNVDAPMRPSRPNIVSVLKLEVAKLPGLDDGATNRESNLVIQLGQKGDHVTACNCNTVVYGMPPETKSKISRVQI